MSAHFLKPVTAGFSGLAVNATSGVGDFLAHSLVLPAILTFMHETLSEPSGPSRSPGVQTVIRCF